MNKQLQNDVWWIIAILGSFVWSVSVSLAGGLVLYWIVKSGDPTALSLSVVVFFCAVISLNRLSEILKAIEKEVE